MKRLSHDAKQGLEDLYFFLVNWWRLDLEEKPHRAMCDVIQRTELDPTTPYALLVVPRGSFKTSIGRGAVVWKQLRQIYLYGNVYHRIVLASATLALGYSSLKVIEGQLRYNEKLNADFGPLWKYSGRLGESSSKTPDGVVLRPRLEQGEIATVAEPSFWVGSERRISVGFHADGALIDDLNNHQNTATDIQREKVHAYWSGIFPILNREDRAGRPSTVILNATPWHDDDVRGRIQRQEREKLAADPGYKSPFNVLQAPAVDDTGEYFFPSRLGEKELASLRETMGPRLFAANYLCDPIGDNGFVDEREIRFRPRDTFPTLRWMRAVVDPNQHTKAKDLGCYTAIMVGGYDNFSNLYVYDALGSREWDSAEVIAQLFLLNETYPNIDIMIEDSHMGHFDHAIRLEEERRSSDSKQRVHLRIRYIECHSESKYQKWEKMQPRFRSGRIFFADEIPPVIKQEIREELVRGRASRFKDFLDTLAMLETGIRPKVLADGKPEDKQREMYEKAKRDHPNGVIVFADVLKGMNFGA